MYRASDRLEHRRMLAELERAADELELDETARSRAGDLFLSNVPETERSRRATLAASIYVGALVSGRRPSQGEVADAVGVSRLTVQQHWRDVLESAGFDAPDW